MVLTSSLLIFVLFRQTIIIIIIITTQRHPLAYNGKQETNLKNRERSRDRRNTKTVVASWHFFFVQYFTNVDQQTKLKYADNAI